MLTSQLGSSGAAPPPGSERAGMVCARLAHLLRAAEEYPCVGSYHSGPPHSLPGMAGDLYIENSSFK